MVVIQLYQEQVLQLSLLILVEQVNTQLKHQGTQLMVALVLVQHILVLVVLVLMVKEMMEVVVVELMRQTM
jgi:hypothetical protein